MKNKKKVPILICHDCKHCSINHCMPCYPTYDLCKIWDENIEYMKEIMQC